MQQPPNQYPNHPPYSQPLPPNQPYPGQYTQPPQQYPPYGPPPMKPKRKIGKRGWIAIAAFVVLICIYGAISDARNQNQANTPAPTATTAQSTQPPATPTQKPKPTPTLTVPQQVQNVAHDNASNYEKVTSTVESGHVTVTITLSEAFDNSGYRIDLRDNCFNVMKAEYQQVPGIKDIEIDFLGPLVDAYGNNSTGGMGMCQLTKETESKFNWSNLSADQAWNVYDQAGYAMAIQG